MHFCIHPGSSSEVNVAEKIVPFTTLSSRPVETVDYVKYVTLLYLTNSKQVLWFQEAFWRDEVILKSIWNQSFDCSRSWCSSIRNHWHLEPQWFKDGISQNDLLTFYAKYVSTETFLNLVRHALRNISRLFYLNKATAAFSLQKSVDWRIICQVAPQSKLP